MSKKKTKASKKEIEEISNTHKIGPMILMMMDEGFPFKFEVPGEEMGEEEIHNVFHLCRQRNITFTYEHGNVTVENGMIF